MLFSKGGQQNTGLLLGAAGPPVTTTRPIQPTTLPPDKQSISITTQQPTSIKNNSPIDPSIICSCHCPISALLLLLSVPLSGRGGSPHPLAMTITTQPKSPWRSCTWKRPREARLSNRQPQFVLVESPLTCPSIAARRAVLSERSLYQELSQPLPPKFGCRHLKHPFLCSLLSRVAAYMFSPSCPHHDSVRHVDTFFQLQKSNPTSTCNRGRVPAVAAVLTGTRARNILTCMWFGTNNLQVAALETTQLRQDSRRRFIS